ncbi:MAG TPA: aminotransferase class III-fold pyridoxal phosphate-dependent enzyme, partial [Burkholderiales bacterium]|nr:aminotransferase class III-fold pyridoxal phosphate-dependent enzyme [Burkholderiales bacterium]
ITGGYLPLSVVMSSERVYRAFYDDRLERGFLHSHSYGGNPLACRAALAVLDVIEDERILERNRHTAAYLNGRAGQIRAHPGVAHFRNTGMIWAFEVRGAGADFPRDFSRRALEAGVLLRPLGATVYWMPPYGITAAETDFLIDAVAGLLDAGA